MIKTALTHYIIDSCLGNILPNIDNVNAPHLIIYLRNEIGLVLNYTYHEFDDNYIIYYGKSIYSVSVLSQYGEVIEYEDFGFSNKQPYVVEPLKSLPHDIDTYIHELYFRSESKRKNLTANEVLGND